MWQGDECFERGVSSFTACGVVEAVGKVRVEAVIVGVSLGVTEGVHGNKAEPHAVHSHDVLLGLPLEPQWSADVGGVVVYELPVRVWREKARGRSLHLAALPRVHRPVRPVPVHDVPELREVVLSCGHADPAVAPGGAVPLVEPTELVHRNAAVSSEEGADSEEGVGVSLEHQAPDGPPGEERGPGGHHPRYRQLLITSIRLLCPTFKYFPQYEHLEYKIVGKEGR